MNTYTKLKFHLERHMYKRGKNKGSAPADQYRRGKTHLRVLARPGTEATNPMVVRMYNTDILTAYEDGSIMLSTGGWWASTTRKNLNDVLRWFVPGVSLYVGSRRVFGMSQPTITISNKTSKYFDGLMLDGNGHYISNPEAFERKRADKEKRAEFRKDVEESGFKDVFPTLYQAATQPRQGWLARPMRKIATNDVHANEWPDLVSIVRYPRFRHQSARPAHDDWRDAWKAFTALCTKDMVEVVRTDVTTL